MDKNEKKLKISHNDLQRQCLTELTSVAGFSGPRGHNIDWFQEICDTVGSDLKLYKAITILNFILIGKYFGHHPNSLRFALSYEFIYGLIQQYKNVIFAI